MRRDNTFNLTAVYGPTTRFLSLVAAALCGVVWGLSYGWPGLEDSAPLFLWGAAGFLSVANFSMTDTDRYQNLLRRYLSFKGALSAMMGFLLALALMEILFGRSIIPPPLEVALGLNLVILFLEWGMRLKVGKIQVTDERLRYIVKEYPWIVVIWLILSITTLIALWILIG